MIRKYHNHKPQTNPDKFYTDWGVNADPRGECVTENVFFSQQNHMLWVLQSTSDEMFLSTINTCLN